MPLHGITQELMVSISNEIWSSMIEVELEPSAIQPSEPLHPDGVSGRIEIFGAWRGEVEIRMSRSLAKRAASAFIGKPCEEVTLEECFDAAQEITNITAGRLKRLLPQICKVTLPSMCACEVLTIPPKGNGESLTVYLGQGTPSLAVSARTSV